MTEATAQFSVVWRDHDREPKVPFNPHWQYGIAVDLTKGFLPACQTDLQWPAPRCGWFEIRCQICGASAAVSTAGRIDDPKSARLPCKLKGNA
jgi:hypothetical protein